MNQAKDLPFLRYRDFSLLLLGRLLSSVAMLTQSVTLGWQVYSIARLDHSVEYSSFLVGMIGLAQFVPMFAFVLLAGETADRYDRRKILIACCALQIVCSASLAYIAGMDRQEMENTLQLRRTQYGGERNASSSQHPPLRAVRPAHQGKHAMGQCPARDDEA